MAGIALKELFWHNTSFIKEINMAVPRNRLSNARKNSKRAHHAKQPKQCTPCSNCGTARISHRVCASCGYYDNRSVIKQEEEKE